MQSYDTLFVAAREVRLRAYAPYSRFAVGAALLAADGSIFTGCNVENISFGLTICAERGAVMAALAAGRAQFTAIAIVADSSAPISPCGACRQVLAEFSPSLTILCGNLSGATYQSTLDHLLPRAKTGILDDCSHLG